MVPNMCFILGVGGLSTCHHGINKPLGATVAVTFWGPICAVSHDFGIVMIVMFTWGSSFSIFKIMLNPSNDS